MAPGSELIYLDYAATTPLDARAAECMRAVQQDAYFNPASNHEAGRRSAKCIAAAALQLASLLRIEPASIVWTSGATESNNLAIIGAAKQRAYRGKHLVTMRTEHKAVVDVFRGLEKQGFEVTWLEPDADGRLSAAKLAAAVRDDTQLASIMHINNETGVIQDIAALGAVCQAHDILFHVDGAQAVGKIAVNLTSLPVDLYSLSAHKFYGPKGIGALFIGDGVVIEPQLFGGGQQQRLRPGTLPVDLIAGLGAAAAVAAEAIDDDLEHLAKLKEQLWSGLRSVSDLRLNSPAERGYPGILNVAVSGVQGESLLLALEPLCVASGSACNSQNQAPSYVLRALGLSDQQAQSAIRFSLGRPTTATQIDAAITIYRSAVEGLRAMAPERMR